LPVPTGPHKIAFGECGNVVFAPEFNVLTKPGFDGVEAVNVVEGALRFEKLDEAVGVVFDEFFFDFGEIGGEQGLLAMLLGLDDAL
jgi:hypothetical protein